jgi:hypothetical protein
MKQLFSSSEGESGAVLTSQTGLALCASVHESSFLRDLNATQFKFNFKIFSSITNYVQNTPNVMRQSGKIPVLGTCWPHLEHTFEMACALASGVTLRFAVNAAIG